MLQRLLASMTLSTVITVVSLVGQVVSVPILIGHWGAETYGEWLALTTTVASLSLLNLGVQSYVLNQMIMHYQRGDLSAGTHVLHASLRLYIVFCGIALLLLLGLALWPGLSGWLNIKSITESHIRVILIVQGFWVTYNLLGGVLMSVLLVINQYPRRLYYSLADRLILLGVPLIVALLGGSPFETVLVMAGLMIVLAGYQVLDVIQRTPFPIGVNQTTWIESRALIRPSLMFLAVRIANVLLTSGIVIIVSGTAGGAAVALYSTTLMMTNFVRTFAGQGLNIIWPEITAAAAQGNASQLRQWHRLIIKLLFAGVLVLGAVFIVFGTDVLQLWVGNQVHIDPVLNILLVYYLILQAPTLVSDIFGLATNHQADLFRIDLVTALLTVGLAIPLVPLMSIRGVALSLLLGQAWGTTREMTVAMGWTYDTTRPFLADWLGRGWMVITLLLVSPIVIWLALPGATLRAATLVPILLLLCVLTWHIWFNDDDRVAVRRILGGARSLFIRFNPSKG